MANVVSISALIDLGSLLFSFLVVWAYMAWFEFMLIWIADLPPEITWYLPRLRGGWYAATCILAALHFVVGHVGLTPHVRDVRAWALAGPLLVVLAMVTYDRPRR